MSCGKLLGSVIGLTILFLVGCGGAPAVTPVAEAPAEQPDEATFEKYFSKISLGKLPADAELDEPDLPTPATTFAVGDQLCVTMGIIGPADELSTEIYGLQEQNYITTVTNFKSVTKNVRFDKGVVVGGDHIQCGTYPFVEGKYEFRVRVGDVLVAMIPFEVK